MSAVVLLAAAVVAAQAGHVLLTVAGVVRSVFVR